MRFLIDTSVLIALSQNDKGTLAVVRALRPHFSHPPGISFMTYMEFYYGLMNKDEKKRQALLSYLQSFPLVLPTAKTAELLAMLKHEHRKKGDTIALADLFIAAQALEEKCALVTSDADFRRIKGLQIIAARCVVR